MKVKGGMAKITYFPKVTKMESITDHKIDYNGVEALRGQQHAAQKLTQVTPRGFFGPKSPFFA